MGEWQGDGRRAFGIVSCRRVRPARPRSEHTLAGRYVTGQAFVAGRGRGDRAARACTGDCWSASRSGCAYGVSDSGRATGHRPRAGRSRGESGAGPAGAGSARGAASSVAGAVCLEGASALEFFGGDSPIASVWLDGSGGAWRWRGGRGSECQTVLDSLCELTERSYWRRVGSARRTPTLLVRGEHGWLERERGAADAAVLLRRRALSRLADAGHDVHIEQPDAWLELRRAVRRGVRHAHVAA